MMKTVTVQLHQLVHNFSSAQCDYLLGHEDDPVDAEMNTDSFLKDLRNLLSPKQEAAITTLRRLFAEGFTMMMLPPDQFEVLELAYREGEDFCLVVKSGQDTLCILCAKELVW